MTASELARSDSWTPTVSSLGIKPLREALAIAKELELDLVEVAPE